MHRQSRRPLWPLRKARHYGSGTRLADCIKQNMQAIDSYRAQMNQQRTLQDRIADLITRWSGSMAFVYLHIAWFGIWILANTGLLGPGSFDPFPFGLLTMIVSLEAIFLSTFVLVSQNRQAELADRRSEMDLQIDLLAEYEMTRLLVLVDAIAKKLDVSAGDDGELAELMVDVKPEELLQELEERAQNGTAVAKPA